MVAFNEVIYRNRQSIERHCPWTELVYLRVESSWDKIGIQLKKENRSLGDMKFMRHSITGALEEVNFSVGRRNHYIREQNSTEKCRGS